MKMIRFAFAGFQHGHILSVADEVEKRADTQTVAAAEADPCVRKAMEEKGRVRITHDDPFAMIDDVDCDVVAIGAAYGDRGALALHALRRGRHVIADKPLCTRLGEWEKIGRLASVRKLAVGCQLSMRSSPDLLSMKELIAEGAIGDVQTVTFLGQHPLMWGTRPAWYFQTGRHGGTINDIAIHGLDAIEWMTGRRFVEVTAARTWNAKTPRAPYFQTGAQVMLRLDNQGGVLGDVSYFSPSRCGYQIPSYWRFTVHGTRGLIERNLGADSLFMARDDDAEPIHVPVEKDRAVPGYLDDFLACVRGEDPAGGLDTDTVLRAAHLSLLAQKAADEGIAGLRIPG